MTRRVALLTLWAARALAADSAQEVWDVVTAMAAALANADAGEFLGLCDSGMSGYEALRANVTALVAQADADSGIDPVRNDGDDHARNVEADWELRLVDRSALQRTWQRRATVKLRIEKRGRKWKVVALDPVSFFAPQSA